MLLQLYGKNNTTKYLATSKGNEAIEEKGRGRKKSHQKRKMAGWK